MCERVEEGRDGREIEARVFGRMTYRATHKGEKRERG